MSGGYPGINSKRKCPECNEWISLKEINNTIVHVVGHPGDVYHDGECYDSYAKRRDKIPPREITFIGDGAGLTGISQSLK